jgi:hypothetical protein
MYGENKMLKIIIVCIISERGSDIYFLSLFLMYFLISVILNVFKLKNHYKLL